MITRSYFAVKPKPELLQLLRAAGVGEAVAYPELFAKKTLSRQRVDLEDDVASVKIAYVAGFLKRILVGAENLSESGRDRCTREIHPQSFDRFWTIDVFADCEDADDLISENLTAHGERVVPAPIRS